MGSNPIAGTIQNREIGSYESYGEPTCYLMDCAVQNSKYTHMEWNTDERNEGLQLIGTMGLNMLLSADRLESCGGNKWQKTLYIR